MNARELVRVLKTPITLLVLLAILIFGAYWGYGMVTAPVAKTGTTPCVEQDVGTELTADKVTVRVFNGSDRPRLAKDTRSYLQAWKFNVPVYNNTDQEVTQTIIIGNSAEDPEVKLLQQYFTNSVAQGDGRSQAGCAWEDLSAATVSDAGSTFPTL